MGCLRGYAPGLNLVKRLFHKPGLQTMEQIQDCIRQILASNSSIKIINA
jgi:hypothetical protein